jgi:hypothetical protein
VGCGSPEISMQSAGFHQFSPSSIVPRVLFASPTLLHTQETWTDVFQALKQNNCQVRLLYLAKISIKIEGEIKTFPDKHKLKQFITIKPIWQKRKHESLGKTKSH